MPSTYFDSDGLKHLELIFDRAMAILEKHHGAPKDVRDTIAARILRLAAEGVHDDELVLKAALDGFIPKPEPLPAGQATIHPTS